MRITFTGNRKIDFIYDATGKKWCKVVNDNGVETYRDYIEGAEYQNGQQDIIHFTEGYVQRDATTDGDANWKGWVYKYTLKDHLGNTRVTYSDRDNNGVVSVSDIEQVNHYYPFGLNMEGSWNGASGAFKYGYNNKELNGDFGLDWIDYGSRWYQPDAPHWLSIDPLSEKYLDMSPYHYVKSNPISNIDIKGGWAISVHYMMTLQALKSYGMTNKKQLDILSNYTSVFADNPGPKTLDGNNFIFGVGVTKKSSINYDLTVNSQELHWEKNSRHQNFNIWHSMQSDWEYDNNQITDEAAMQRGMSFGWSEIFKAAESGVSLDDLQVNSREIQRFGQGMHALQDAYAHKGVNWGRHSTFNDIYGDTKEAMAMTKSAVQVYKLMTNDFKGLGDSVKGIKLDGMSKKQREQVFKKIEEFLSSQNNSGK